MSPDIGLDADMETSAPVRDENLRLVHSPGHGDWLRRQLRDRYLALILSALVFAGAGIWFAMTPDNAVVDDSVVYVEEGETQEVIASLEADGYTVIVGAPEQQSASGTLPPAIEIALGYLPFILMGVALLMAAKLFLDVRRIRGWQRDHETFLASYGRETD